MTSDDESWDENDSNLYQHAKSELELIGLLDDDSDYDGMLGRAVLELIRTFAKQGHSGHSAMITANLFMELVSYKPIGDLTDNPEEWMPILEGLAVENEPLWQNRRNSEAFSEDGGKTYYRLSDPMLSDGNLPIHISKEYVRAE